MSEPSNEPANLVLEQLRLIRMAVAALDAKVEAMDTKFEDKFKILSLENTNFRRQTIAEVYKVYSQ